MITDTQCVFARHYPAKNGRKDATLVKLVHYDENKVKLGKEVKMLYEQTRPFYVTNKMHRNHKQKKWHESKDKLTEFITTDSLMAKEVGKALGKPFSKLPLRELSASPYLYGADMKIDNFIRDRFANKYNNVNNEFLDVCMADIETTPNFDQIDEEIKIITLSMEDKWHISVLSSFAPTLSKKEMAEKFSFLAKQYLTDKYTDVPYTITVYDSERQLIIDTINKIHEWDPDYLAWWNLT